MTMCLKYNFPLRTVVVSALYEVCHLVRELPLSPGSLRERAQPRAQPERGCGGR